MFLVEGQSFKSLQDARDYVKYDLQYGVHTIWTIDGQPQEAWKGSRLVDIPEDELNEYKTPLIFCNSFPESPVTLTIGELKETQNKDARRLTVTIHTPFTVWDKQAQSEKQIHGDATVYCKNNDNALNNLLGAFASINKNLGDTVTLTRQGEAFVAVEGGELGATVQAAPRTTTAQAIQTAQAAPPVSRHTTQDIGQKFAECYGLAKWAIVDVNEMTNATPTDIGAAAACIFIADTRAGTVLNKTVKVEDHIPPSAHGASFPDVSESDDLPF